MRPEHVTWYQVRTNSEIPSVIQNLITQKTYRFYASCPDVYDEFPVLFCLYDDQEVVSYIYAIPDQIEFRDGNRWPWAWTGGLRTREKFQGRGAATRLLKYVEHVLGEKGIGRGSVYSAPVTLALYDKLGKASVSRARRLLYLKRAKPFLSTRLKKVRVIDLVDNVYQYVMWPIIKVVSLWLLPRSGLSRELVAPYALRERMPSPSGGRGRAGFTREPGKLAWKLANTKHLHRFYLLSDRDGHVRGYFITREKTVNEGRLDEYRLMTVVDYDAVAGSAGWVYRAAFENAWRLFVSGDADILEIVTNDREVYRASRRCLGISAGKGMSFTSMPPADIDTAAVRDELKACHVTAFCGDAFTYK